MALTPEEQQEMEELQKQLGETPAQAVSPGTAPDQINGIPTSYLNDSGLMKNLSPEEQEEYQNLQKDIANMQGVHQKAASTVQKIGQVMDIPGGIVRSGVAKAYDTGLLTKTPGVNNLYHEGDFTKALQGQGPTTLDYLQRSGLNNDFKTKLMGVLGDVASDPVTYVNPISEGGDVLKWAGSALKDSAQGRDITNSLKRLLGKSLSGAGTLVKNPVTGVIPEPSTIGQTLSGTPKDVLQQAYKNPEVLNLAEQGPQAISNAFDLFHQNLKQTVGSQRAALGQKLAQEIGSAGGTVDTQPLRDMIQGLKNQYANTKDLAEQPLNKEAIAKIQDAYEKLFGKKETEMVQSKILADNGKPFMNEVKISDEIPRYISPDAALDLQQNLKDLADFGSLGQGIDSRFAETATQSDKDLMQTAGDAYKQLNNQFDKLTAGKSTELKRLYANYVNNQKILNPAFKTPTSAMNSVRNIGNASKDTILRALEKLDQTAGTNLAENAKDLRASSFIQKAPLEPVSGQGVTSTGRQQLAQGAGATFGLQHGTPAGIIGSVVGKMGASPPVMGNIADIGGRIADSSPEWLKTMAAKYGNRLDQRLLWNEILKQKQQQQGQ